MPHYLYQTLSPSGAKHSGEIDANDQAAALQNLQHRGLYVIRIAEAAARAATKSGGGKGRRVPLKELAALARQLAIMAQGGVPLTDALTCVREQVISRPLGQALDEVLQDVLEGHTLARVLSHQPLVFPRLFADMVRAGEMSGQLPKVLDELASYLEANLDVSRRSGPPSPTRWCCWASLWLPSFSWSLSSCLGSPPCSGTCMSRSR